MLRYTLLWLCAWMQNNPAVTGGVLLILIIYKAIDLSVDLHRKPNRGKTITQLAVVQMEKQFVFSPSLLDCCCRTSHRDKALWHPHLQRPTLAPVVLFYGNKQLNMHVIWTVLCGSKTHINPGLVSCSICCRAQSLTSPFLPKEMVLASMSRTQVMKSPWVKLLSVSVCSPLWYRFPLYARYSHMSDVVRWLKSCTGHRETPTHVPSLPRFSFTM